MYAVNVADIFNFHYLTENQGVPTDVELASLSSKLGSEWQKLGTFLGLAYHTLQSINCDIHATEDKIRYMLFTWQQSLSQQDDGYGILAKALVQCRRRDLAETVKGKFQADFLVLVHAL